jgi:hypothetical protein
MGTSSKALIGMVKGMLSKLCIIKLLETQRKSIIKMVSKKDYIHIMRKMGSFGVHIQKINYMVFQFFKTIVYSSMKLVSVVKFSTRKRPSRSFRKHLIQQSSLMTERRVLRGSGMH